jgi:hypothetical protein
VIHKESHTSQLCNNRSNLAASAYQIAQHEQSSQFWISQQIGGFLRLQDYGWAPSTKPDNCVWVIMENFKSLGVFTKGTKINSLNKLCRQFNTDILAGCKTQADWRQASKEQQFRNVIGMGVETRSIVAHNIMSRCNGINMADALWWQWDASLLRSSSQELTLTGLDVGVGWESALEIKKPE